jgi:hypothetical protein
VIIRSAIDYVDNWRDTHTLLELILVFLKTLPCPGKAVNHVGKSPKDKNGLIILIAKYVLIERQLIFRYTMNLDCARVHQGINFRLKSCSAKIGEGYALD